jgi:hypothetical protein
MTCGLFALDAASFGGGCERREDRARLNRSPVLQRFAILHDESSHTRSFCSKGRQIHITFFDYSTQKV